MALGRARSLPVVRSGDDGLKFCDNESQQVTVEYGRFGLSLDFAEGERRIYPVLRCGQHLAGC